MIKVALIEDNLEFQRHFTELIGAAPDMALVGVASDGREALVLIAQDRADVYLVDLCLPDINGLQLIETISRQCVDACSMVFTVLGDDKTIIQSIEAGASGYLLKDTPNAEILACIRNLHEGGSPISPTIARRLLTLFKDQPPKPVPSESPLSHREAEVLGLIAKGLTFSEIGQILSISSHTVTAHVRNIYDKMSVHSRGEAVYEAGRMGWL